MQVSPLRQALASPVMTKTAFQFVLLQDQMENNFELNDFDTLTL